ncbi:N-terminal acetyltransferase [Ascochyta clinopodiicola]|nr:N-terminal acetyltransferase [Ascochyta clinopodiicola]
MSLFGGDSSAPPTESEYESGSDLPPSPIAQTLRPSLHSPQSAQGIDTARGLQDPAIEGFAQDTAGNDADSEESDDDEVERPNRFRGPPQTWKGYTAADRQIAESLQQLEDTDLAAHLYNAHALKRRVRKPATELSTLKSWQNKDAWLKEGKELQYTDAAGQPQTELVPAKDWTAWPLPPTSLYTLSNGFRRAAVAPEENEWVIGGSGAVDPGTELKEEMLSVFLRLAKQSWHKKNWQDEGQPDAKNRARSRARSKSQSIHYDIDMKDGSGDESKRSDGEATGGNGVKRGRKPQPELTIKPTILADDAKAHRLLRPTVASMLDKLDDVALALQRTRLNHFGRGGFGDGSSQSEFTTDAETTGRESRSRSQSRAKSAPRSKPVTRQSSRPSSSRASRAPKSKKKASKPKVQSEDSDSASDYGAQFGNKDGLELDAIRNPTLRRKRSRSESTMDEEDIANTRDWSRAGLMDWSEVLGVAAVKGWNQQALARTAQRCAALFGESMSFTPLHEDLATRSPANLVNLITTTVPAPSRLTIDAPSSTKRPYFQPGAIRCPHTDCYGHRKDFAMSYRVIEHCMRIHGYDPRSNDSDNEERTHGGVHIDGFLQPITAKQGWLGHGRSKAGGKKRKTEEADLADLNAVAAVIEE